MNIRAKDLQFKRTTPHGWVTTVKGRGLDIAAAPVLHDRLYDWKTRTYVDPFTGCDSGTGAYRKGVFLDALRTSDVVAMQRDKSATDNSSAGMIGVWKVERYEIADCGTVTIVLGDRIAN